MRDGSRARELLPSVLLTLLSVVQALALEALWSEIRESPELFASGVPGWVASLQALAMFQGIVLVWLFYIGVVMRYSWIPSTRDSLAPFVLGAGELSMIQMIGPEWLPYWFWVLGAVFAFSAWISSSMFRAAFADPANRGESGGDSDVFVGSWISWIAAGAIVCCGFVVSWGGGASAIVCLVFANILLFGQGLIVQHFWRQWVGSLDA